MAAEPRPVPLLRAALPTGDLTTIRRLLDDGRTTLTAIAAQTGVPLEYLHLLIGEFDPSFVRHRSTLDPAVRSSGILVMSRAMLIDLYEGRQLGLARSAKSTASHGAP